METIKNTPIVIGNYQGVNFHYIFNENDRFLINASDIAKHFNIDLSAFLANQEADRWIKHLLKKANTEGKSRTIDDIVLIENGIYYFHKFLIYELTKPYHDFYWWIDEFFYDLMVKYQNPLN